MKDKIIHYDLLLSCSHDPGMISGRDGMKYNFIVACGVSKLGSTPMSLGPDYSTIKKRVNCKNCKRTKIFKMA